MKFYIPDIGVFNSSDKEIFEKVKLYNSETVNGEISNRKIRSLNLVSEKHDYYEVGKKAEDNQEIVLLILEGKDLFLICTFNRGVKKGNAIWASKSNAFNVEYFDD